MKIYKSILSIKFFVLSLIFLSPAKIKAQENTFAGGVLNITAVERQNSASVSLHTKQTHQSDGIYLRSTSGHGSSDSRVTDSVKVNSTSFTLRGEQLSESEFNANFTIGANALNCSAPQDICYGCVNRSFSGPLRFLGDGLQNVDPNNRSYSVSTRYSVAFSSNSPAPNYNGPTFLRFAANKLNIQDLTQYITYGNKSYSCSLKAATYQNGLISNPKIDDNPLTVTSDCKLSWDTTGAEVGSKYAFQLYITSAQQAPRPSFAPSSWGGCFPRTEVDLLIEVGCSEEQQQTGDPSCFLCSSQNLTTTYKQIEKETENLFLNLKKAVKIGKKTSKKCKVDQNMDKKMANLDKQHKKRSDIAMRTASALSISAPAVAGVCLAPSSFFCSSSDITTQSLYANHVQVATKFSNRVTRRARRTVRMAGTCGKKQIRKLNNIENNNIKFIDAIKATLKTLPESSTICGDTK